MSSRSIVVKFRADVADLQAKAKAGAQAIKGVGDAADSASKTSGTKLAAIGTGLSKGLDKVEKNSQHINTLGNGFLTLGVAAAAGVGVAVKKFADFDASMSLVAASGQDARDNLDALRQAAIDAGAQTAFSATEAAGGIEALAKAGVSAQDTLGGGLKGALDLAAAGNLGVSDSAEVAATAMTQFGLSGAQVPHIADLLAAAAGKAQGEVSDFAGALNQSGLVASQFGLSIEETTGTLAAFASAGLLGSDAGTSFKTMLLRLANPSAEAAATMKQLGINAYDAQGQFVGIESLAGQLQKSMGGLSDAQRDAALSTIFGSDAIRAANVLYTQGSAGIKQWTANVDDAGFAAETAAIRMDNLKGDFEQFTGSLETAFIGAGSGGNDFLRSLTQSATDMVNEFNQLPSSVQEGSLRILALGAGAALAVAGLSKLVVGVAATRTALAALGVQAVGTRARLAALNGGGLLAVAGFVAVQAASAALNDNLAKNSAGIDGYVESLSKLGDSSSDLDSQFKQVGNSGYLYPIFSQSERITDTASAFKALGDTLNPVSQGFRKVGDALGMASTAGIWADEFDKLDKALVQMDPDKAAEAFTRLSAQAREAGLSTEQINATFDDYKKKQLEQADAAAVAFRAGERASAGNDAAAGGMQRAGAAAAQSAEDIKAATDAMYAQANAALAMSGNAIAVEAAMDAARDAAKKNGETLDINTAKGRANQQALNDLASATLNATAAMVEQERPAKEILATNERAKESYVKSAVAMGVQRDEAIRMANALFQIPDSVQSKVVVQGVNVSKQEAKDLNEALKSIPAEKRAEIVTIAQTKGADAAYKAMAKVIDKEVTAATKGDAAGAKKVKSEMDRLKDKLVKALAKGDEKGATKVLNEMKKLRDKTVTAHTKADTSGADEARRAMNAVNSKTVVITTVNKQRKAAAATGGLITEAGVLYRSNGGAVWGAGSATSDSIPAMLSNGEYVIKAASAMKLGVDRLQHMNQTGTLPGFAAGGPVTAGIPANVDFSRIWAMITALTRPLAAIQSAQVAFNKATATRAREDRETAAALKAYRAAIAKDKKVDSKSSEKAKQKAKDAYDKQVDQQKDALSKLTDSTNTLRAAQQALADSARQQSDALADPYRSKSTDIDDWLESMKQGAVDLKAFQGQIAGLRKLGVSETIIQQISEQGAVVGSELAGQILEGGKALADSLNQANGNLQKVADGLGYDLTQATGRYAMGGLISGPGTGTSDSILARVSAGEWVVPARSVPGNLGLLKAMTYGDRTGLPAYAGGGLVRPSISRNIRQGDQYVTITGGDPHATVRRMQAAQRDAFTMLTTRAQ